MDQSLRDTIDAAWSAALGVDRSVLAASGTHIATAQPGSNDIVSVLIGRTCVVLVPPDLAEAAHDVFSGLSAEGAFTIEALGQFIGNDGRVFGPSWHHYGDNNSLRSRPDPSAEQVIGSHPGLLTFLESNSTEDWAESGFPKEPADADPNTTTFCVLRDADKIVAAGNMTDWRGAPADVGVLVHPSQRGQSFAVRLVGAMVDTALPRVGAVRYRALATNDASLSIAATLGFERYGGNYLARAAPR